MPKLRLGVICGGRSGEHEVSLMSAESVIAAAEKERYDIVRIFISREGKWTCGGEAVDPWRLSELIDFALPILHGPNGEDGTVQGLLKLADIPFGGCGVLGCAATMDKIVARKIFASEGLKQAKHLDLRDADTDGGPRLEAALNRICAELEFPVFVKPANMGSSVGISKVRERSGLADALVLASRYDGRIIVEQGIEAARELEAAVMGNDELFCGRVGEVLPAAEFYDYGSKYFDEASKLLVPAPIESFQEDAILDMAKRAYRACGCCGYARVDFLMDARTQEIYINEINAIPGFTRTSMFPRLMTASGMSYPQIIDRIVELGYERYNAENNR